MRTGTTLTFGAAVRTTTRKRSLSLAVQQQPQHRIYLDRPRAQLNLRKARICSALLHYNQLKAVVRSRLEYRHQLNQRPHQVCLGLHRAYRSLRKLVTSSAQQQHNQLKTAAHSHSAYQHQHRQQVTHLH